MLTYDRLLLNMTRVLQDGNQIGDRGAEIIGEGLKVNSSLQKLYLVRLVIFICVCIVVLLLRERAGGESAEVSRVVHAHACV